MTPLSDDFLKTCRQHKGFALRGESMTRIETFVAAAFAFGVTLIIISYDEIPRNSEQLLHAIKTVPAFIASFATLMWIWSSHATWSRRFGLEDSKTIFLSGSLVLTVLVYLYPLRIVMQALFYSMTEGVLPREFELQTVFDVRMLFVMFATGFGLVALHLLLLNLHALKSRDYLRLNSLECFETLSAVYSWAIVIFTSVFAGLIAVYAKPDDIGLSGMLFFSLWITQTLLRITRHRQKKKLAM